MARDAQDRPALERLAAEAAAAAAKAPNDAEAQYRVRPGHRRTSPKWRSNCATTRPRSRPPSAASSAAEQAVALKPDDAENYRVLGTLYGQAVTDMMSGLNYGPRAKDAINKAVSLAPKSSSV